MPGLVSMGTPQGLGWLGLWKAPVREKVEGGLGDLWGEKSRPSGCLSWLWSSIPGEDMEAQDWVHMFICRLEKETTPLSSAACNRPQPGLDHNPEESR